MDLGFYLEIRFPTDVSACTHCAEPAELKDLTDVPGRGKRCLHCAVRDDCVLCLNVELREDLVEVPDLGLVCGNCIRLEAQRLAGTGSAARVPVC